MLLLKCTLLIFFVPGCENAGEVAAEVEGNKIYLREVDNLISNSLHEYLSAIYDARSIATTEIIARKLIEIDAKARNISFDSALAAGTMRIGEKISLKEYIKVNGLQNGVFDEANPLNLVDLKTDEGAKILESSYQKHLKIRYDSRMCGATREVLGGA
ncbi:hypothetical protein DYBT9623_02593 [Dyadobacter sp. CECT 9623]|uniref:Uncharacterized protein n=1 Tax=Dyadobacter linearis TaxID=2823330 RepID=A0ABM8UQU1_9BACT|nr:hypothetical protein [Dyadobacter sp. CECT 9623]CAG5069856.1 hypothetical protein DYBT9623_02593 [Dyadobacter sp. CECT 9623]